MSPQVLTDVHKEHFTNVAKNMTHALLEATDVSQSMPWRLVHDKQFSIYRAELSNGGPCNVHAVTKLVAHIEEVTEALITTSTDSYKAMMSTLSSDFVDGAVVANILTPTPENPHRYVGLKWVAFKSSAMGRSKDKDFMILEYVDLVESPNGQKTAFRIMQSVDVPEALDTAPSQGKFTREQVPLVGFIYYTTQKEGELKMTYTCNVDSSDSLPWMANIAIIAHVEKSITRTLKYIEFQRVRNDSIELHQRVIPISAETGACHVCKKKFSFYRHSYSCLKCANNVCSNCYSLRTAAVPEVGERKLRICTLCIIQVRQARRGSNDVKKDHFEPAITCVNALQKRQSLEDVLTPVRNLIATAYKPFSSQPNQRRPTSHPPSAEKLAQRRVTVGPSQLTPQLEMFKEGLPSLLQHQQHPTPEKRRSTVGHTDLKTSLARFHQVYSAANAAASHREDDETSDDGSCDLVSSDSEDEEDEDEDEDSDDNIQNQRVELTAKALKNLLAQSEENHKMANLMRQLSDTHSAAAHSRKSSQSSLQSQPHHRKASSGTVVLYDFELMRELEKQREDEKRKKFLASQGARRRSSGPEIARHPPASSSFMF